LAGSYKIDITRSQFTTVNAILTRKDNVARLAYLRFRCKLLYIPLMCLKSSGAGNHRRKKKIHKIPVKFSKIEFEEFLL
jgi:hypothetical protein